MSTVHKKNWFVWNEQIDNLLIAQEHPMLPEIVDVFIFEGDLSVIPGEFTVYVGYRLLENGTIIYNGLEPIHFLLIIPQKSTTNLKSKQRINS